MQRPTGMALAHGAVTGTGQPLEPSARALMENYFGRDFSHVRVHVDDRAAASARAVDALAYTVGHDVVFARGMYQPATSAGRHLLAHELTHVVQQSGAVGFPADDRIDAPTSPAEREADAVANNFERGAPSAVRHATGTPTLSRQGAALAEPAPPPIVIPEGEAANDNALEPITLPSGETGPRYAPSPNDTSLDAAFARAQIRDNAERIRLEQERPIATLDRGGSAPDFITVEGTRTHAWMGGIGGGGSVRVRIRRFHVLDAIEYAVARVNTPEQLQQVARDYLPLTAAVEEGIAITRRERRFDAIPMGTPIRVLPLWDAPVYPSNFDPQASARLAVFTAAVRTRAQAVPALARSRFIPEQRRRNGCRIEPIEPMGGDPLSTLYCHLATGSPLSYKITIESATGGLTNRWAEIDSLRGNTWYECKCGYEALLSGAARGERVASSVLDSLDHQVLNHVHIASTCGLDYRYIVSSHAVAERLRSRWFGNVTIDVVPFESCD